MRKKILLFCLLLLCSCSFTLLYAQTSVITGKVTDKESGEPLIGATVSAKGAKTSTMTDMNGQFTLNKLPNTGNVTLTVSYLGYLSFNLDTKSSGTVNLKLAKDVTALNEVVVVGYGTVKRKDLTGSVASVSGKEIAAVPVANVAQAMQGKLPGVNIVAQDGRPGADISIRVRGGGSISQSNQPLILIDGIPGSLNDIASDQVESIDVLKDASSTAIYGARGANGVILITTKGAKAGKTSVVFNSYVKFNTPIKYLEALNPYDYLKYVWANTAANGSTYQEPFEKLYGLGVNSGNNTGGIESYRNLATDDIQEKVYNESVSWNHYLALTGGTDKTKILFSANYTDDQGMKLNSYSKRTTATVKLNHKLRENLTFDLNTRYTNSPSMNDESTTSGSGSILSAAYRFRPISTANILGDKTQLLLGTIENYGKNSLWDTYNPAARTADYFPYSKSDNLTTIGSLNWGIIKGLTYHTDLSLNGEWNQRKYWSGAIYNSKYTDDTGVKLYAGDADYRKSDSWGMRWSNTLNYEFVVNKTSKFNILAGQEFANSGGTLLSVQANHFPSNYTMETAFAQIDQYDKTPGVGSSSISSSVSVPNRIVSYFGRVNYALSDKYLATFTFRSDASSKFTPTNRRAYFPAGAVAWKISEESFMKNITWVDNFKLRASYGSVGNDGISSKLWTQDWVSANDQRMQYAVNHQYQSAYQYASATLANPDLKWETTITRNIGTDFGLFNNRLSGTVDVYHNTVKNLLTLTSIPGITGFTKTYANVGQTSNKGIELSLTGTILQNKDWRVSAGGNINFNKNKIDKLASSVNGLYRTSWAGTATYPADDYVLQQGQPVGLVRGLVYDGVYTPADFNYNNGLYTLKPGVTDLGNFIGVLHGITTADRPATQYAYPGLPKFKDLTPDGIINEKDISVIGNMNPKHTGGLNLNVAYKNIDLGLNFNWSYGNQIYNANKLAALYGPKEAGVYENKLAFMKDSYKIYDVVNGGLVRLKTPDELNAANVNSTLPLAYNEIGVVSTLGIEDGSFLRLNTLTLGYNVPKSLISKIGISNIRIYGSIYNVLTVTGYSGLDPEVNVNSAADKTFTYPTTGLDYGAYPRARSFVAGLNLNF